MLRCVRSGEATTFLEEILFVFEKGSQRGFEGSWNCRTSVRNPGPFNNRIGRLPAERRRVAALVRKEGGEPDFPMQSSLIIASNGRTESVAFFLLPPASRALCPEVFLCSSRTYEPCGLFSFIVISPAPSSSSPDPSITLITREECEF